MIRTRAADREGMHMRYSADSEMQALFASPEAMEVLDRYFPKILKNPALQMTARMTLRCVASFAQSGLDAETLDAIDAELRAIPEGDTVHV